MAVCGKKAAPMLPEPGPDLFQVSLRQPQSGQPVTREKLEAPFTMHRWQAFDPSFNLEQKHQPMRLSLITMFAHQSGQVQIRCRQLNSQFLVGFTAAAGIWGFAHVHMKFPAARAPKTAVRFLSSLKEKHLVPGIETIQQRRDFVWQRHGSKRGLRSPVRSRRGNEADEALSHVGGYDDCLHE